MWMDSHAHLDPFLEDRSWPDVQRRAGEAGVTTIIAIGGSSAANERAVRVAGQERNVYAVVGYDRDAAEQDPDWAALERQLAEPGVVGIGETGLDYHYNRDTAPAQRTLLERNLAVALRHRLPVVVHTRDADEDTLRLLRAFVDQWDNPSRPPGVIHCFTGGTPFAGALLELGFLISFSGIVTFKKADDLRAVLPVIPLDQLLIETDAPYLAPVPRRGKRNEPAFVVHVGEYIAATLGRTPEELARITTTNGRRLFGLENSG